MGRRKRREGSSGWEGGRDHLDGEEGGIIWMGRREGSSGWGGGRDHLDGEEGAVKFYILHIKY